MEGSRIGRDLLILSRERDCCVLEFMFVGFPNFENPDFPTYLIVFPVFFFFPVCPFEIMSSRLVLSLSYFSQIAPRALSAPFCIFAKHDLLLLLLPLNPHLHTRPLIPTFFIKSDIIFTTIQNQLIDAQTFHRQCV